MRSQQQAVAQRLRFVPGDEQRVLLVTRGMVRRKVQRLEVVIIGFNLRSFLDRVAQIAKDSNNLVHRLDDGVFHADGATNARQRDVKWLLIDAVQWSYL